MKIVAKNQNVFFASAGPMTADAVGREIDRLFAGLPKSGVAFAAPAVPSLKALGRTVLLERPVVQTIIVAEGPSGWTDAPDANRATLDAFLDRHHKDGLSARRLTPDELFHPGTLETPKV